MPGVKDYFSFSKRERNAFIALLLIIVGFIFLPDLFQPKRVPAAISKELQSELTRPVDKNSAASPEDESWKTPFNDPRQKDVRLFEFDPNTLDEAGFITLGVPERTARTIINYRNKGGKFRNAEDLRKIYTLKKEDADRIIPYARVKANDVYIPKENAVPQAAGPAIEIRLFEFDPNTLDEAGFITLGLPARTARTIINYRNKGGRFRTAEDLRKIYSLQKEDADRIIPYAKIRTQDGNAIVAGNDHPKKVYQKPPVATLDINTATAEDWKALPGIGDILSVRIVKFRQSIGGFTSIEQVAKTYGLKDSTFQFIKPYLKFTPAVKDPAKP